MLRVVTTTDYTVYVCAHVYCRRTCLCMDMHTDVHRGQRLHQASCITLSIERGVSPKPVPLSPQHGGHKYKDMPGCHVGTEGLESGPCASTASDLTHCALPTTRDLCALQGRNTGLLHSKEDPEPELFELKEVEIRVLEKRGGEA